MSVDATNHVWKHTNYPAAQSYILLAIADVVNDAYKNRFFMGIKELAKKTKCSERTVQRALRDFEQDGWLEDSGEKRKDQFTEYIFHFLKGDKLTPPSGVVTDEVASGDRSGIKVVTNEVSIPLLELNRTQRTQFDEFWKIYPKHNGGVINNKKAWAKAVKVASPEEIIAGAKRYRDDPNRSLQFTAYPASWLNKGMWTDAPLTPQSFKDGSRSLVNTPTLVPAPFDPKEFARKPLDPERVAKIRRENGV